MSFKTAKDDKCWIDVGFRPILNIALVVSRCTYFSNWNRDNCTADSTRRTVLQGCIDHERRFRGKSSVWLLKYPIWTTQILERGKNFFVKQVFLSSVWVMSILTACSSPSDNLCLSGILWAQFYKYNQLRILATSPVIYFSQE